MKQCLLIAFCLILTNKISAQSPYTYETKNIYHKGNSLYWKSQYDSAVYYFTQAIDRDSLYTDAYYYRAMSFMKLGKYAQSEQDFDCVVVLNPLYKPSFENLVYRDRAELFKLQKQYDKAAQEFYKWAKLAPGDFKPFRILAHFYKTIDKRDSATNVYNHAISIFPNEVQLYSARAWNYTILKEYELAKNDFLKLTLMDSLDADNWIGLGNSNLGLGNVDLAIEYYKKGILLSDKNDEANQILYKLYLKEALQKKEEEEKLKQKK
jgi:tetratricopeptide (TPR) repeat protein